MLIKKSLDIEAILEAMNREHLVLFVGAGVSANSNLPSWTALVKEFATGLGINREINSDDFLKIPQYYYNQRGKNEYLKKIIGIFDTPLSPNVIHDYILKFKPRHIITTNYDNLIEQAIEKHFMFYDSVKEDIDLPYASNGRMLIKMHGDLAKKNIVLKEDDYLNYSDNFKLIESYVKSIFINNTVLFVGYSLQDYDLKLILKNLQGILGDHFQKAYLIDSSESPRLSVEKDYFKNLGVNLIDKFDISKEYSNKEISELKAPQGKNIVRILDYILQYRESVRNPLDFCYDKFQAFDSLNEIRLKDIINLLDIGNYSIEEITTLKVFPNKDDNFFIDLINRLNAIKQSYVQQDWETKRKYDYINSTFAKTKLSKISVEDQNFTLDLSYRNEPSIIKYVLFNDYYSINLIAKQDYKIISDFENKIINELMRAYAKYLVNQFVSAFEILEKVSIESYRNKDFILLYIIEFNKRYLIKKLKRNSGAQTVILGTDLGETVFVEQITKIIEAYKNSNLKLNDVYEMLAQKDKDKVKFIHDLLQEQGYLSQQLLRIKELTEKVEKDLNTNFSSPDSTSVNNMVSNVYEFFDYTHNNFIMVDQYSEVKEYYFSYIKSLLSTYSVKEKSKVQTAQNALFSGFLFHRLPNHSFSCKDVIIILKYLDWKKINELFEEYIIDEIEISFPSIHLKGLFSNLITSHLEIEYTIGLREILKNMLCLFGKIKINAQDLNELIDSLLRLLSSSYVEHDIYLTLLKFLYDQKQNKSIESAVVAKLIIAFVNKLLDFKYNGHQGGFELDALNNNKYILGLVNLLDQSEYDNVSIELDIEKIIISIEHGNLSNNKQSIILQILIPLFRFLGPVDQNSVKAIIEEFLLQNFDVKIYGEACEGGILLSTEHFEEELFLKVQQTKNKVENSSVKSFPDPLRSELGVLVALLRHNQIINKEPFKEFIGIDDFYDLVIQEDNFDYQKFNLEWLPYLNEDEIKKILSNSSNKEILRINFVKSLVEDELGHQIKRFYLDYFET
ncbi:SIR2 family protein [Paenibacillus polymyxa]|uniref:SIR2 family protein n=1 Tax=Paenibacillus polymyxa TaxID=1406 RepID=UPI002AB4FD97|nr:SIR2 family protein [Paenibacillus polymyxa]MDY8025661.1 SIR2 family protein [Paenibacillus polymyxa]